MRFLFTLPRVDRLLFGAGVAHVAIAVACLAWLVLVTATPILGVHPALKPLKFALSIAAFLLTLAVLMPALAVGDTTRRVLSGVLAASMSGEMIILAAQALRGRRSHFNLETPLDTALTAIMMLGVVVMLGAMIVVALRATLRPLDATPLVAMAWRAALWMFLLAAGSGFGMGGRAGHTIGAADGGPGMPLTNWSTAHGDLRVSHFFALHALQIVPLYALAVSWLPVRASAQWILLAAGIAAVLALIAWTWLQALAARPLFAAG